MERLVGANPMLLGIDQFLDRRICSQELLGSLARRSAVAMVPPVDLLHEVLSSPCWQNCAARITPHRW
ncbi:MAG: hypothetical protein AAEJ47_04100 [Planctomycetota bacterium]